MTGFEPEFRFCKDLKTNNFTSLASPAPRSHSTCPYMKRNDVKKQNKCLINVLHEITHFRILYNPL